MNIRIVAITEEEIRRAFALLDASGLVKVGLVKVYQQRNGRFAGYVNETAETIESGHQSMSVARAEGQIKMTRPKKSRRGLARQ